MKLIKLLSVMVIPLIPSVAYAAEISNSWQNITMSQRKGIVVREATNLTSTHNRCNNVAFVCANTNRTTEVAALPPVAGRVSGNPALIQGRFGRQGNFEVVVPLASGGLALYFRDNDDPNLPWKGPFPFGQSVGPVAAVSLIQSNFGSPGNLEVVARVGNRLAFFFRESGPNSTWTGPFFFTSGF